MRYNCIHCTLRWSGIPSQVYSHHGHVYTSSLGHTHFGFKSKYRYKSQTDCNTKGPSISVFRLCVSECAVVHFWFVNVFCTYRPCFLPVTHLAKFLSKLTPNFYNAEHDVQQTQSNALTKLTRRCMKLHSHSQWSSTGFSDKHSEDFRR